jgi:hypothetical protein
VGFSLLAAIIGATLWMIGPDKASRSSIRDGAPVLFGPSTNPPEATTRLPPSIAGTGFSRVGPLKTALTRDLNVPIDFWGKIVDQDGNPLSGAVIKIGIREWLVQSPVYPAAKENRHIVQSGPDGVFSLQGGWGDVLGIDEVIKPGYLLSPKATREFNFKRGGKVAPTAPVVFKMWKTGPKQQLTEASKFFGIIPDNRWYTIDLMQGTKTEGESQDGDLHVRLIRPPQVAVKEKYGWSYELKVPNGGLLETDDEFMLLAPEAGYKKNHLQQFNAEDKAWTYLLRDKRFFILTRGQIYGRFSMDVHADYAGKAALDLKYAVNPAGSRSLE